MHATSIGKAISAAIAFGGLSIAAGAAALGPELPKRAWLIVGGIDGFAIGAAAFILILIFYSHTPAFSPVSSSPNVRSLDNTEGQELKRMLVRHVARGKPVTIGFLADDPEAEQFAGQIGRFLHENKFTVVGFAAEPPTVLLEPGIGIDRGNHILVGPIESRAHSPSTNASFPSEPIPENPPPAEALQASGGSWT
jgi:hypothetical protein